MIINTTIGGDYESFNILEYGNGLALKSPGLGKKKVIPLTADTVSHYEIFREDDNEIDLRLFFKDGKETICMMDRSTFARFETAISLSSKELQSQGKINAAAPEQEKSIQLVPLFGAGLVIAGLLYYLYG